MGLDVTHDCWHGAYLAFMRFRNEVLAAAGGRYTGSTSGFGSTGFMLDGKTYSWAEFTEANFQGEWNELPEDPLVVLLAHSDCDGIIPTDICLRLADRLEGLIPNLATDKDWGHLSLREDVETFVAGLRLAATRGEDVEFC